VVPASVVVLLPTAALVAVDVAVAAGVHVAAAGAHHAGVVAGSGPVASDGRAALARARRARGRARRAVRRARGLRPLVAALHPGRAPAAVDVRALARLAVGARARVVGLSVPARTVRAPGRGAARVGAGARVVAGADARAAVRAVGD